MLHGKAGGNIPGPGRLNPACSPADSGNKGTRVPTAAKGAEL